MKIEFQQIRDIVDAIFSKMGYNIKNLNIQFPEPLGIKIIREKDNSISMTFTDLLPKVTWKKFITLSARIMGMTLGETGGILRLKYLPDIKFAYDEQAEQLFGQQYSFEDVERDIFLEFQNEESRTIAKKCLQYASEWAIITRQGCDFALADHNTKRKLKNNCKNFVLDNLKNDPEIQSGSIILTFLFFYVVLPVILKFILERLFKKLFSSL